MKASIIIIVLAMIAAGCDTIEPAVTAPAATARNSQASATAQATTPVVAPSAPAPVPATPMAASPAATGSNGSAPFHDSENYMPPPPAVAK